MSIRIPEGKVFVPRAPGVAAALLFAAEELGYERSEAVRTVTGGYHVDEAVAQKYQESVPEGQEIPNTANATDTSASTAATLSPQAQADPSAAAATDAPGAQGSQGSDAAPNENPKDDDPLTTQPREGWGHDQFDAWAENQNPKVEFPKGANLAQKLEHVTNPPAGN
jgi:hypothetical protein